MKPKKLMQSILVMSLLGVPVSLAGEWYKPAIAQAQGDLASQRAQLVQALQWGGAMPGSGMSAEDAEAFMSRLEQLALEGVNLRGGDGSWLAAEYQASSDMSHADQINMLAYLDQYVQSQQGGDTGATAGATNPVGVPELEQVYHSPEIDLSTIKKPLVFVMTGNNVPIQVVLDLKAGTVELAFGNSLVNPTSLANKSVYRVTVLDEVSDSFRIFREQGGERVIQTVEAPIVLDVTDLLSGAGLTDFNDGSVMYLFVNEAGTYSLGVQHLAGNVEPDQMDVALEYRQGIWDFSQGAGQLVYSDEAVPADRDNVDRAISSLADGRETVPAPDFFQHIFYLLPNGYEYWQSEGRWLANGDTMQVPHEIDQIVPAAAAAGDLRILVDQYGEELPEADQLHQPEDTIGGFGPHVKIVHQLQSLIDRPQEEILAVYPSQRFANSASSDTRLCYTLFDIDQNGHPELLVASADGHWLLDIFTTQGSDYQSVIPEAYVNAQSFISIHTDGTLELHPQLEGEAGDYKYFRLSEDGYQRVEAGPTEAPIYDLSTLHWFRLLPTSYNAVSEDAASSGFAYPGDAVPPTQALNVDDGYKYAVNPADLPMSGSFVNADQKWWSILEKIQ